MIKGLREAKQWSCDTNKTISSESMEQSQLGQAAVKIDTTGVTERRRGSGRRRSARTAQNMATVADLICSQEDAPHSHKTPQRFNVKRVFLDHQYVVLQNTTYN